MHLALKADQIFHNMVFVTSVCYLCWYILLLLVLRPKSNSSFSAAFICISLPLQIEHMLFIGRHFSVAKQNTRQRASWANIFLLKMIQYMLLLTPKEFSSLTWMILWVQGMQFSFCFGIFLNENVTCWIRKFKDLFLVWAHSNKVISTTIVHSD